MRSCPSCGREADDSALECPWCGIVYAKWGSDWHGAERRPPRTTRTPGASPTASVRSASVFKVLLFPLIGAMLLSGAFWFFLIRPQLQSVARYGSGGSRSASAEMQLALEESTGVFDRMAMLPIDPMGAASSGTEMLIAQRSAPGGFLRMRREGADGFTVQHVAVTESYYRQEVGFNFIEWNGELWVAYTRGSWFRKPDDQFYFVRLAAYDLGILELTKAPPLLGCMAWDGSGYWAATRRNTPDSGEEAWLYRLDSNLRVVDRYPPTGSAGCQGMAWDGERLWMADVFDRTIRIFDVSGAVPELIHSYDTGISYLSGLAWDGESMWVTEYGNDHIMRLRHRERVAWSGGTDPISAEASSVGQLMAGSAVPPRSQVVERSELERLQHDLRDDHWATRMRAEQRLRELDIPIGFDREQSSFATDDEQMEAVDWQAEVRGDALYGSWNLWFSPILFESHRPAAGSLISIPIFRRYTITVEGATLPAPIEMTYEASSGHNVRSDVLLASGLPPGVYTISCFMHAQYVEPNGTNMILNESALSLQVER